MTLSHAIRSSQAGVDVDFRFLHVPETPTKNGKKVEGVGGKISDWILHLVSAVLFSKQLSTTPGAPPHSSTSPDATRGREPPTAFPTIRNSVPNARIKHTFSFLFPLELSLCD